MFATYTPNSNADWWLLADLVLTLAVVAVATVIIGCCEKEEDRQYNRNLPRTM